MVTPAPTTSGKPGSACSTLPSCTLLRAPMLSDSVSPRSTAPNQMLAASASSTLPITTALSATQALSAMRGASAPSW